MLKLFSHRSTREQGFRGENKSNPVVYFALQGLVKNFRGWVVCERGKGVSVDFDAWVPKLKTVFFGPSTTDGIIQNSTQPGFEPTISDH